MIVCGACGGQEFGVVVEMRSVDSHAEIEDDMVLVPSTMVNEPDVVEVSVECLACGDLSLVGNEDWEML